MGPSAANVPMRTPPQTPPADGQAFSLTTATALTHSRMDIWTSLQLDHMPTLPFALAFKYF